MLQEEEPPNSNGNDIYDGETGPVEELHQVVFIFVFLIENCGLVFLYPISVLCIVLQEYPFTFGLGRIRGRKCNRTPGTDRAGNT